MNHLLSKRQSLLLQPSVLLACIAGVLLGRSGIVSLPVSITAALLSLAGCVMLQSWRRFAGIVLCFAFLGTIAGYHAYHPQLPETGTHEITGIVTEEIRSGKSTQYRTVLRNLTIDGKPFPSGGYWSFYTDELPEKLIPGVSVSFTGRIYEPFEEENEAGFNFREYLLQQGISIGIYGMTDLSVTGSSTSLRGIAARARKALSEHLSDVMGPESGAYASAMLLGTRNLLPTEDTAAFNRMGIGHILSVSGFHVGVLCMLLGMLSRLFKIPRIPDLIIHALILSAYCLLTGMHAPVIRASLIVLLAKYGRLRLRVRWSVLLVCLSAVIQLLLYPAQLTSAGFQLTYGALAGITLITPALQKLLEPDHRWTSFLWRALCAAVGAQIGVLLPELYWYQELPVLGICFNVLLLLFSQLLLSLYWVIFFLQWIPGIGHAVGTLGAQITSLFVSAARAAGSYEWLTLWTPQANLLTGIGCAVLLVFGSWLLKCSGKSRVTGLLSGVLLILLSMTRLPHTGLQYIQLSVGSADAAVILDQQDVCVIDTGEEGSALSSWLHQRRLSVDQLIITHLHRDHAGGIRDLLDDGIPVRECLLSTEAFQAAADPETISLIEELQEAGTDIRFLARGDVLTLPSGTMTVLWPEHGKIRPNTDANLSSLVLRADFGSTSMLLTGDLDGLYEMYAAVPADILKAAHHGSSSSTSAEFLAAVSPSVILQSCGDDAREVSLRERAREIPVYCTNSAGQITIDIKKDTYSISTYR